jgi:hypothetical protein
MFDLNSIFIGFAKLLTIAIFIFSFIALYIKLMQDMKATDFKIFWLAFWNRRWRIFIMIVILFGMVFVFNLEQVHRPKNVLTDNVAPTTMGYDEPRTIVIKEVKPLDREAAYEQNKQQNKAAKEAFKKLEN